MVLPSRPSAVVLDSPHSGRDYPEDFHHVCPLHRLRQMEDFLIDELYGFAPELGATFLCAKFPRTYLDVNRAPEDVDPELLAPDERHGLSPGEKSELGMGLVWRLLQGEPIYGRPLTRGEIDGRIERCWLPYHAALARAITDAHARHGFSVHLDCHSMPSRAHVYPTELEHRMPFDFLVGDRDGTTAAAFVTQRVADHLREEGFSVGVNQIFKGVELVRRYGNPAEQRHSVQLEINKKLYMDEEQLVLHDGFARVQEALARLVASLGELRP